jgi:hypothetical protein
MDKTATVANVTNPHDVLISIATTARRVPANNGRTIFNKGNTAVKNIIRIHTEARIPPSAIL